MSHRCLLAFLLAVLVVAQASALEEKKTPAAEGYVKLEIKGRLGYTVWTTKSGPRVPEGWSSRTTITAPGPRNMDLNPFAPGAPSREEWAELIKIPAGMCFPLDFGSNKELAERGKKFKDQMVIVKGTLEIVEEDLVGGPHPGLGGPPPRPYIVVRVTDIQLVDEKR